MTTNLVVPTESQLPNTDNNFAFLTWKDDGESLLHQIELNGATLERTQWEVGDWIVKGVKKFGKERAYDEAERIFKNADGGRFDRGYLRTVVWVVNRFRNNPSLRKDTKLKWSHFKELAYIRDEKLREEVFNYFNNGAEHSVRKIREYVQQKLDENEERGSGKTQKAASKYWVSMPASLKKDYRERIKKLARARDVGVEDILGKIVMEYFDKNKKKIATEIEDAKIAKAKKKAKR